MPVGVPPVTDRPLTDPGAGYEAYLPAQTILAHISAAVVVTDRQGNLLYANPFAVALFGFSLSAFVGIWEKPLQLNPAHPDYSFDLREITWMHRIIWASQ